MRLGSANTYDNALQNIYTRQSDIASQQEKLTSTKNINRASDDPTGAAQAERALTRITRVASEQRALGAQSSSITLAESTLGDAGSLLQGLRELVVGAGNGGLNASDRASKAQEMQSLRDQLFTLANRTDTSGIPLFGGLGSTSTPFTDTAAGVTFNGISGQRSSTDVAVPGAMDGQAIWMNVRSGNGTFNVTPPATNTGTMSTDAGQVVSPTLVTGDSYSVNFTVAAGVTSYQVFDDTTDPTHAAAPAAQPYVAGQAINFGGMSFVANGAPANGDAVKITPSTQTNVFKVLDDAITGIKNATATSSSVSQTVALALTQIDTSMNRIQAAQGQAGEWLNRADNITSAQADRTLQLTTDKSRVEDLDMVKGLSDFQREQTGYQVALQSYAQIQKLSLFNYIS